MKSVGTSIKQKALDLGFLDCGIVPSAMLEEEQRHLKAWLSEGMHGEMGYMERNPDKRLDPGLLVENARTVIVVLQNYYTPAVQTDPEAPVLSKYAYGTDYHFVMKDKLRQLLEFVRAEAGPCNGRPFVDSAPLLERAWARRAGLGWVGKHSNLISLVHGSYFFIGELVIDIELPYDEPREVRDHCGTCTRCIDACPTKAIVANRVVDANKCISYQTIELKGELDQNLKGQFDNRIFGCDICQDVCPWNLKAKAHNEPAFDPPPGLLELSHDQWHQMDKPLFNQFFRKSAVKRTGFEGLRRNLQFIKKDDGQ
jgi:epoxyqueuosine reductase